MSLSRVKVRRDVTANPGGTRSSAPVKSIHMLTLVEFLSGLQRNIHHTPSRVDVASFRVGAHPELIPLLVNISKVAPLRLLIGVSSDKEGMTQVSGADPCEGIMEELIEAGEGRIQARLTLGSHMKCWIFHRKHTTINKQRIFHSSYMVGGRNLNFSQWEDIMTELDDEMGYTYLTNHFQSLWNRARVIEVSDFTKAWIENEKPRRRSSDGTH